ncbi:hypothetical protein BGZ82_004135, partial [Podila clonocystis]
LEEKPDICYVSIKYAHDLAATSRHARDRSNSTYATLRKTLTSTSMKWLYPLADVDRHKHYRIMT